MLARCRKVIDGLNALWRTPFTYVTATWEALHMEGVRDLLTGTAPLSSGRLLDNVSSQASRHPEIEEILYGVAQHVEQ